jgi:hypothetical protein
MTKEIYTQEKFEHFRRPLTTDEREGFHNSLRILLSPGDSYTPSALPLSTTLRGGNTPNSEITPVMPDGAYYRRPDAERTLKQVSGELTDVLDYPSDPEIVDVISHQLRRSPYAEFSPLHFPGGTQGKEVRVQSANPYLDPLTHHAARVGRHDSSYAIRYMLHFESKPIPQLREVTPDTLRAYRIGRRVMISAYDQQRQILTAWRPLDSLSLQYAEPREAGAPADVEKLFDVSVHQPQIQFDSAQVAPVMHMLESQKAQALAESRTPYFGLYPHYEECRYGPKHVLYRKIGAKRLQEFDVPVRYGWDDLDVSSNSNTIIRPDAIVERAGTVWIQDKELGIEVPYRRGGVIRRFHSSMDTDMKRYLEEGLTSRDDRFIQWSPVTPGDGHP